LPGDYQFGRRSPRCSGCDREFAAGEEYRSALVLEEREAALGAEAIEARLAAAEGPGPEDHTAQPPDPLQPLEAGLPFRRVDFCAACWDPEKGADYFSFWKAAVPEGGEDTRPLARRIDVETVYDMFRRLEGQADPQQQKFRFILALMLMRKKRLKLSGVVDSPHGEHLALEDREEDVTHKVLDPGLGEEEVDILRDQVGRLLGGEEGTTDGAETGRQSAAEPAPDQAAR
jgi:hypothetical protein